MGNKYSTCKKWDRKIFYLDRHENTLLLYLYMYIENPFYENKQEQKLCIALTEKLNYDVSTISENTINNRLEQLNKSLLEGKLNLKTLYSNNYELVSDNSVKNILTLLETAIENSILKQTIENLKNKLSLNGRFTNR